MKTESWEHGLVSSFGAGRRAAMVSCGRLFHRLSPPTCKPCSSWRQPLRRMSLTALEERSDFSLLSHMSFLQFARQKSTPPSHLNLTFVACVTTFGSCLSRRWKNLAWTSESFLPATMPEDPPSNETARFIRSEGQRRHCFKWIDGCRGRCSLARLYHYHWSLKG